MTASRDRKTLGHDVGTSDHSDFSIWKETHAGDGRPRPPYAGLVRHFDSLTKGSLRRLDERLEATLKEIGVTFGIGRTDPWNRKPWTCDLLPQIFGIEEWKLISEALNQRLRAFELFLKDIYGKREILREGVLPVQPVLGSPHRQSVANKLPLPGNAFLHLAGAAMARLPNGQMAFKHHYFSNASGLAYMMQNRRALSRVIPESFEKFAIHPLAGTPGEILEHLRGLSSEQEPVVVLLSPGPGSAAHLEHGFLARRMGIPLVLGGDLIVLGKAVYLKTVGGLEKVDVIYSRLADHWLDPLSFHRESVIGVPGLIQCVREGSVLLANAPGAQLADDRALLPFVARILKFYLGERPLLPQLETYWLGDLDQRELVLSELERFTIRPLYGEKILLGGDGQQPSHRALSQARRTILANPAHYVAQPQECDAEALAYHGGRRGFVRQDHIVFALRRSQRSFQIIPGALTRTTTAETRYASSELGGGSKDTWVEAPRVLASEAGDVLLLRRIPPPAQVVSSRSAEAFYWLGRYLERASALASMIRVIENLEAEELNATERTLYRPVWNAMLPPLENPRGVPRQGISSTAGRQRLVLDTAEPDSVASAIRRAQDNASSVFDLLSLEAWAIIERLSGLFGKSRKSKTEAARKASAGVRDGVPEFFAVAEATMVADGALALCFVGRLLERAIISANALASAAASGFLSATAPSYESDIRLSAFLRLLASRDVYRRIYQMRITPGHVAELLWSHGAAPRSAVRCLNLCAEQLSSAAGLESPATEQAIGWLKNLAEEISGTDWHSLIEGELKTLQEIQTRFLERLHELHHQLADSFLNLQIHVEQHSEKAAPSRRYDP